MSNIKLGNAGHGYDGLHILVVQAVARVNAQAPFCARCDCAAQARQFSFYRRCVWGIGIGAGMKLDDGGSRPLSRVDLGGFRRSEEHTSELQSLMRISYAVFCLK